MTFAEALAELGISADATPDQARRAYLRLLKTRKPEVDPEGFMRLRAAFDQVKGILGARAAFGRRAALPVDDEVQEDPSGHDGSQEEPPGDVAGRQEEQPEEPGSIAPADPTPRPPPRPIEAARADEAASKGEGDEGDEDDEDGEGDEDDEDYEDDEDDEGDEDEEEEPSVVEAERLLACGDHGGAAAELERLFDAALEEPGGPLPPTNLAIVVLLHLHEQELLDEASTLQQSVEAWFEATKLETRLLRGEAAVVWAMIRELGALKKKFPVTVRASIARGLRTGRLDVMHTELQALEKRRPTVALDAATRLRRRAPILAHQVGDVLDPPDADTGTRSAPRGSTWGLGMILVVMLNVVRVVFNSSSAPPRPAPASYQAPVNPAEPSREELFERAIHRADRVKSHAIFQQTQLGGSLTLDYKQMESLAGRVLRALRSHDCQIARLAMRGIDELPTIGDDIARVEVAELSRALDRICPPPAIEGHPPGGDPNRP